MAVTLVTAMHFIATTPLSGNHLFRMLAVCVDTYRQQHIWTIRAGDPVNGMKVK